MDIYLLCEDVLVNIDGHTEYATTVLRGVYLSDVEAARSIWSNEMHVRKTRAGYHFDSLDDLELVTRERP